MRAIGTLRHDSNSYRSIPGWPRAKRPDAVGDVKGAALRRHRDGPRSAAEVCCDACRVTRCQFKLPARVGVDPRRCPRRMGVYVAYCVPYSAAGAPTCRSTGASAAQIPTQFSKGGAVTGGNARTISDDGHVGGFLAIGAAIVVGTTTPEPDLDFADCRTAPA